MQRRMLRFINIMDIRAHIDHQNLFNMSWLTVPDRVAYFQLLHVYRIHKDLAPSYLRPSFVPLTTVHTHATRGSELNFQMSRDISMSQSGFAFSAIKQWNDLPISVKDVPSLGAFKKKLKSFFLSRYVWIRLIVILRF